MKTSAVAGMESGRGYMSFCRQLLIDAGLRTFRRSAEVKAEDVKEETD